MKIIILVFIFLFRITSLFSQQQYFEHFGVQDGLSQSSVYGIFQDSKGFMWFATGDGLNRFDGQNFRTYRTVTNEKLRGNGNFFGENIFEDKNGDIWFSERSGLVKYDYKSDKISKIFPNNDTAKFSNLIEIIGITDNQDLWFWHRGDCIFSYNIIHKKIRVIEIVDTSLKSSLTVYRKACLDKNGNIWYSLKNGLACYNIHENKTSYFLKQKETKTSLMNGGQIDPILIEKNGDILIYKKNGISRFSPKENNLKEIFNFPDNTVFTALLKKNHTLWIATKNRGLFRLDETSQEIINYQNNAFDNKSIPSNIINCLYKDFSENLWLGLEVSGIGKTDLKHSNFLNYSKFNLPRLGANFIKCLYNDSSQRIWSGTYLGGLNITDLKTKKTTLILDKDKIKNTISCFLKLPDGKLLMGGSAGVAYINERTYEYNYIPFEEKPIIKQGENLVTHLIYTKEKKLLIATENGIYEGIENKGRIDRIRKTSVLQTFNVSSIFQAKDGILWIGNISSAYLYRYRIHNEKYVKIDSLLFGLNVRSFYEDTSKNILWMASEKGLVKYDLAQKTHQIINKKNGLPNEYLYGILPDNDGYLWLSSNGGLSCYSPKQETFRNYDISDGLQSNEFNTGAFYRNINGELFFGGINGFNCFSPHKITENKYTPKVVLTEIQVLDQDYITDMNPAILKKIALKYEQNSISLRFMALEYTNFSKNAYEYKLEGLDENWVKSNKGFARYAGLKPGNYVFKVRASNNDNVWSEAVFLLRISIETPWWSSWWFISLSILFFVGVTFIFIRNIFAAKIRKQKQIIDRQKTLAEERNRISKDMHDDLGSGLSKIAILSEVLKSGIKEEKEYEQLEKISATAKDLVDSMGQIIWAMNPVNDSAENTIAYIREYTLDFFENSHIHCKFELPENKIKIKLTQQKRRNIFLVYKETLNNILKHAEATEIKVHISSRMQHIVLFVSDNGKGFDFSQTRKFGNGLINMKKRMDEIGGAYYIKSEPSKGTVTIISDGKQIRY